ncbi:MAG: NTPase (NACHT family)-like protein [Gemmatimonadetes bacterium]|nr:NTPase (NACHT family)-like protein [Gammaproteobacteria bacterium]MYE95457.1 NTPase (NACHT family)-like protein [Gemmatimonadota bacterium]MYJ12140.1 NTPase (NACHT family)-like protein [Gemmatimonadota bacterium]
MPFDYQFENLGEARFQHLCQALLAHEFPGVQCFPIHQPDGGRDAISTSWSTDDDSFTVYQVKYVRRPSALSQPWKWFTDTVEAELPKITKLIPAGAKRYVLLTNVPGTAHLDSGSIDIVRQFLHDTVPIPSQCLWRDDLSRRLDSHPDLRWAYSELITGPDLLRLLLASGLRDNVQRRTLAISAYLTDQLNLDTEVRFKQIELQNDLLDLFIDVPAMIRPQSKRQIHAARRLGHLRPQHAVGHDPTREQNEHPGCVATLLDSRFQDQFPLVVVQGAPGQGKSTIVQYMSQIHRMRLLDRDIPDHNAGHNQSFRTRLPFKVDLRDLSTWLAGGNPFATGAGQPEGQTTLRSLESFLAEQVVQHSGGAGFDVSDVQAVVRASAILIVFDGLDEIADLTRRATVTEELCRGVKRLKALAIDLQCVVTSRPSVFAESPSFPEEYLYLELRSITTAACQTYADKWIRAKGITRRDASEIRRVLTEKLAQPHLAELSRNPMQLAILLSLVHSRGSSLPEKRTALYDSYMDYFVSRESEKSSVVRDHRELLVEVHGYLAWVLHAEAERSENGGRVSHSKLSTLVREYLREEGHDGTLAEALFAGVVERVVALVSRIEGTFEFEVQPLREYFAARYLYNTATYSPTGAEAPGTLPDRFDAMARNGYWLNVTRFYAGCFSKGEIPALVDRLEELLKEPMYEHTSYGRFLASMLLGDWVFSQHPRSMKKVIDIVLDGVERRCFINAAIRYRGPDTTLLLPQRSGRDELIDKCFTILEDEPPFDFALSTIAIVTENAPINHRVEYCLDALTNKEGASFTIWLMYSLYLHVLGRLDGEQLDAVFRERTIDPIHLDILVKGGRTELLQERPEEYRRAIDLVLGRRIVVRHHGQPRSWIEVLGSCFAGLQQWGPPVSLGRLGEHMEDEKDVDEGLPFAEQIRNFATVVGEHNEISRGKWSRTLLPWNDIVETGRREFGDRWAFFELAAQAAGIRSSEEKGSGLRDLFDTDAALCERARYARLRAGDRNWWSDTLQRSSDRLDQMFSALVLMSWGSAKTIAGNARALEDLLRSCCDVDWPVIVQSMRRIDNAVRRWGGRRGLNIRDQELACRGSARLIASLWPRLSRESQDMCYEAVIGPYSGNDGVVLNICQRATLTRLRAGKVGWETALPRIAAAYRAMGSLDSAATYFLGRHVANKGIPRKVAVSVLDTPESYPAELIAMAEGALRYQLSESVVPVIEVAKAEGWFRSR